jgi:hypothetical protein
MNLPILLNLNKKRVFCATTFVHITYIRKTFFGTKGFYRPLEEGADFVVDG